MAILCMNLFWYVRSWYSNILLSLITISTIKIFTTGAVLKSGSGSTSTLASRSKRQTLTNARTHSSLMSIERHSQGRVLARPQPPLRNTARLRVAFINTQGIIFGAMQTSNELFACLSQSTRTYQLFGHFCSCNGGAFWKLFTTLSKPPCFLYGTVVVDCEFCGSSNMLLEMYSQLLTLFCIMVHG